jgi:hypothetical protein
MRFHTRTCHPRASSAGSKQQQPTAPAAIAHQRPANAAQHHQQAQRQQQQQLETAQLALASAQLRHLLWRLEQH